MKNSRGEMEKYYEKLREKGWRKRKMVWKIKRERK